MRHNHGLLHNFLGSLTQLHNTRVHGGKLWGGVGSDLAQRDGHVLSQVDVALKAAETRGSN